MTKAEVCANNLISKIKEGTIEKDTLMNSARDFTETGERAALCRYKSYLRTLAYMLNRKGDDICTHNKGDGFDFDA
jgi:hypothetical protein